jgi:hypothetical protein
MTICFRKWRFIEVKAIYSDWISLNTLDTRAELAGIKLLRMAIFEESINERLRNVVHISALLDKSGRIWAVVPRLYHSNRHVRAQAFELLDNVGRHQDQPLAAQASRHE